MVLDVDTDSDTDLAQDWQMMEARLSAGYFFSMQTWIWARLKKISFYKTSFHGSRMHAFFYTWVQCADSKELDEEPSTPDRLVLSDTEIAVPSAAASSAA